MCTRQAVTAIEGGPFQDWTEFVQPKPKVVGGEDLDAAEGDRGCVCHERAQEEQAGRRRQCYDGWVTDEITG